MNEVGTFVGSSRSCRVYKTSLATSHILHHHLLGPNLGPLSPGHPSRELPVSALVPVRLFLTWPPEGAFSTRVSGLQAHRASAVWTEVSGALCLGHFTQAPQAFLLPLEIPQAPSTSLYPWQVLPLQSSVRSDSSLLMILFCSDPFVNFSWCEWALWALGLCVVCGHFPGAWHPGRAC